MHSTKKLLLAIYWIIFLPVQLRAMEAKDIDEDRDNLSISAELYLEQQVQHFMQKADYLTDDKDEVEQLLREHTSKYTWNKALRACYALQEFNEIPFVKKGRKQVILFILGKSYLHTIDNDLFDKAYNRAKLHEKPILLDTLRNTYDNLPQDQSKYDKVVKKGFYAAITSKDIFKTTFLIEESIAEINPPEECCRGIYMRNGQCPLVLATQQGSLELVRLLLDKGAHVDMCQSGDIFSLFVATEQANEAIVRLLLERGACVNIRTVNGTTPLILASYKGNIALVKLLLANNADVTVRDQYYGRTPFMAAAQQGHRDIVALLLGYISLTDMDNPDRMGLNIAAKNGHINIVNDLNSRGWDINRKTPLGWTPLMSAACHGQVKMVEWLLDHGADDSLRNNDNETAYDLAKEKKHHDIVRLLS